VSAASPRRDEVQVDDEVERLQQHADRDRNRHLDQVAWDRALGEVFHGPEGCGKSATVSGWRIDT
jgi:hypothetical protein